MRIAQKALFSIWLINTATWLRLRVLHWYSRTISCHSGIYRWVLNGMKQKCGAPTARKMFLAFWEYTSKRINDTFLKSFMDSRCNNLVLFRRPAPRVYYPELCSAAVLCSICLLKPEHLRHSYMVMIYDVYFRAIRLLSASAGDADRLVCVLCSSSGFERL